MWLAYDFALKPCPPLEQAAPMTPVGPVLEGDEAMGVNATDGEGERRSTRRCG